MPTISKTANPASTTATPSHTMNLTWQEDLLTAYRSDPRCDITATSPGSASSIYKVTIDAPDRRIRLYDHPPCGTESHDSFDATRLKCAAKHRQPERLTATDLSMSEDPPTGTVRHGNMTYQSLACPDCYNVFRTTELYGIGGPGLNPYYRQKPISSVGTHQAQSAQAPAPPTSVDRKGKGDGRIKGRAHVLSSAGTRRKPKK